MIDNRKNMNLKEKLFFENKNKEYIKNRSFSKFFKLLKCSNY